MEVPLRGSQFPSLQAYYLYADYCSGEILAAKESGGTWSVALLLNTPHLITTFGEDESGELYVAHQAGKGKRNTVKLALAEPD